MLVLLFSCLVLPLLSFTITGCLGETGEEEIGTGWTKFSNMEVFPDEESDSPWTVNGNFVTKSISEGKLTLETRGATVGFLSQSNSSFDNAVGTTVEIRFRVIKGITNPEDRDGFIFSFQDGTYEGKLSFMSDKLLIYDGNTLKEEYPMNTRGFHTYRMTIVGSTFTTYVDGRQVATVTLQNRVGNKQVIFGDGLPKPGANFKAEIAYMGYSVVGAYSP